MTLLAYNLIVCYVLSHQEGDLEFCDDVLNKQLKVRMSVLDFLCIMNRCLLFVNIMVDHFRYIQKEFGSYFSKGAWNL